MAFAFAFTVAIEMAFATAAVATCAAAATAAGLPPRLWLFGCSYGYLLTALAAYAIPAMTMRC